MLCEISHTYTWLHSYADSKKVGLTEDQSGGAVARGWERKGKEKLGRKAGEYVRKETLWCATIQ